jgi:hypothetical protein
MTEQEAIATGMHTLHKTSADDGKRKADAMSASSPSQREICGANSHSGPLSTRLNRGQETEQRLDASVWVIDVNFVPTSLDNRDARARDRVADHHLFTER